MPWRDGITTIQTSSKKDKDFADISHTIHELVYRVGSDPVTGVMVNLQGHILSSNDSIADDTHIRIRTNDETIMQGKIRTIEQESFNVSHKYLIYGWIRPPAEGSSWHFSSGTGSMSGVFNLMSWGGLPGSVRGSYLNSTNTFPNWQNIGVRSDYRDWTNRGSQNRNLADWMCCLTMDRGNTDWTVRLLFPPEDTFTGFHSVDTTEDLNIYEYSIDFTTDHIFTQRSITGRNGIYSYDAPDGTEDLIGGRRVLHLPISSSLSTTALKNRIPKIWESGAKPRKVVTISLSSDTNRNRAEDIQKLCEIRGKIRLTLPRYGSTDKSHDLFVAHVEREMHWDRADRLQVRLVGFD